MTFSDEQLQKEKDDWHLAVFEGREVLACLILSPDKGHKVQMRQVAVKGTSQRKGWGRQLVRYSEQFAGERGVRKIFCHARKEAVPFYERLNYKITHGPFLEIGIEHYEMEKDL